MKQIIISRDSMGRFTTKLWAKIKWITIRAFVLAAILDLTGWAFYAGMKAVKPEQVFAEKIVEVQVPMEAPIMKKIAKCESGDQHYKNGQVIVNVNTNGSYDTGRYQINSVWNKTAGKMGYDLTKEKDNHDFAMYLYANYGTGPWESSREKCWNR